MTADPVAVEVEGLRFERDGRLVLDIPALRIEAGRRTVLLGPNGSGKTTLLRLIAALERPQVGSIRVGGLPVRPDRATRQRMAFVFQELVFVSRSVRDNLELGLELRGVGARERRAEAETAARRLGVDALLERQASHLSGGEARRVSLARALCLRAPLVLLDEPLSGLDAATRERLADELPALLGEFHATTLIVTHDRDEALRLAEDLVVLVEGRVLASGPRDAIAGTPDRAAVAALLGHLVLPTATGPVAVPPGALRLGAGSMQWWLRVESVLDRFDRRELLGTCAGVRVRVELGEREVGPRPGERVIVHAARHRPVTGEPGAARPR